MHALKTSAVAAALAACGFCAQAQIVNGGFEAGLSGWATVGDVSTQASTQAGTQAGAAQLLLTTAGLAADEFDLAGELIGPFNLSGTAAVTVGVAGGLETLAGFAIGAFDPAGDFAYEGSLASQSFSAQAGDTLGFLWNFGTRDTFPDTAFVAIDGVVVTLASAAGAALPGSGNDFFQTGVQSFTHRFTTSGSHTLAFAVVDGGDNAVRSALAVDQVLLSPVPEPQTLALLLAGLGGVGLAAGRSRRR